MQSAEQHQTSSTLNQQTSSSSQGKSKNLGILLELIKFIRPYQWKVIAALVALVFTASLTLSVGQGVRLLIDEGFAQQSTQELSSAIQLILALTVMISIGTFFRFYLVSSVGERVSADIRLAVFNHVITLHPSYFETNGSGDIMSRITTDTTLLQSIIGSSFSMAMRSALMCVGAVIMLFATNIKLTLIVLASVPFILVPILFYGRRVRALSRQSQDSMADVGSYAGEAIEHIKTVQSYSHEAQERASFATEVERAFEIGRQRVKQRAILISGVIVIVFSAISGMLWVGGSDVINGTMSGGDLGAFVFYAIMVASSLATISEVLGELQRAAGATERLIEILQVESHIVAPSDKVVSTQQLASEVIFDDVTFHYPSRPEHAAIENLALKAEEGKVLALVGPSGAGKTTLFELLQRFYDPQSGQVTLGGVDVRQMDPNELRQQMALVPQQPALFSNNVLHNIRYGNPDATDEQVIEAAKKAHAHDFIMKLPEGYDSFLGERGVRLSGGQRQRIAIARAILKDPNILLLDEATSALDSESEHHVQQALEELMRNRTTIIIAHRLSTIQHADQIAVLDHGKLVDVGNHNELLQSCELYQRLVELQFKHMDR
ncbi:MULTISPECIES: ABC transporter ATP-binding protein/permease [Vibrio]|uniref:ABC transporter ATP-binding protein/permease n=1 Tax=Vibrio TaxID=662 RepID=UPI0001B958A6|nr:MULTISPECIES: ABC transporter ATP-binding protein/permease [Vibrio]EEX32333.1 putative ATP-binding/permease fusion ABC transporter [Vibrio coralliilyticus ATCC BAA-450]MCM5508159.1 ABC transporter ATP-binding protein/permease [Vibrio sp. SCSIO 43169]MDE3897709.1 ABC transporter ATP-binding protein/permease [Vibrio sp. CC007]QFT39369.1 Multidrug resistance ABC transporter ATP-binding/permease protein BmrA [Vibrio sp. THAF64]QGM36093.1 Multidrug resistance ABC transporter ATP-binding/permease